MIRAGSLLSLAALSLLPCGCDGQQYVSPDSVELVVSSDATGTERVKRCHDIPVLLGSQVKARYVVEDELTTTISVTRDQVEVTFQDPNRAYEPFVVTTEPFEEAGTSLLADSPPDGYTVELRSGCTPND